MQPDPFPVFPANPVFHVELFAMEKEALISLLDASRVLGMDPI
jgi:hypothetical protein